MKHISKKNKIRALKILTGVVIISSFLGFFSFLNFTKKESTKTALASNVVKNLTSDVVLAGSCGNFQVATKTPNLAVHFHC